MIRPLYYTTFVLELHLSLLFLGYIVLYGFVVVFICLFALLVCVVLLVVLVVLF